MAFFRIYDSAGKEVVKVDMYVPVTGVTITPTASAYSLEVEFDQDRPSDYEFDPAVADGRVFFGLGEEGSNTSTISVGTKTPVRWYEFDVNLYCKVGFGIEINLLTSRAFANRVDKTSYLAKRYELVGTLRSACSVVDPVIRVQLNTNPSPDINYMYIPSFRRYYFISDIISIANGVWEIHAHCDVLMSNKDQIKAQIVTVARNQYNYNDLLIDDMLPAQADHDVFYLDPTFPATGNPFASLVDGQIALTVVGGKEVAKNE